MDALLSDGGTIRHLYTPQQRPRVQLAYSLRLCLVNTSLRIWLPCGGTYPIRTRLSKLAKRNRHWSYSQQQSFITLLRRLDNISTPHHNSRPSLVHYIVCISSHSTWPWISFTVATSVLFHVLHSPGTCLGLCTCGDHVKITQRPAIAL